MTLESELETIRTNIVTNLTSKGVTASNTESLNDLVGKVNTVKTPINSSLVLKETYQNDISGVVDCLRDKFRINLSKQGVETLSTDGLTTLSNSISLIKLDTVLTLTSDKTSASTGETVTLTATLVDINGNPVNGATIIFMEGTTTLYSSITNNLGVINYTYSSTVEGSKSLKCVFDGNTNYNPCTSNVSVLNITNIIYQPVLNGTEAITTIGTNNSPVISNNMLCGGCGYLSAGWSNSTNWKLTLDYKIGNSQNGWFIAPNNITSRNSTWIQLGYMNGSGFYVIYSNGSAGMRDTQLGNFNLNTWYSATLTKTGNNTILYDLGQGATGTWIWDSLSTITTLCVGTDYWGGNATTNTCIRNIQVVKV